MSVIFYDIAEKLALGNARKMPSMDALLAEADIVTLHPPGHSRVHRQPSRLPNPTPCHGAAHIPHRPQVTLQEFNAWESTLETRGANYGSQGAQTYQHAVTGSTQEFKLTTPDGTKIWADGVSYNPKTGGAAVEVKYVDNPGGSSVYEGSAPQFVIDGALGGEYGFDKEILRYAQVIADPTNPLERLDLVVSTDAAKNFLGSRVASLFGSRGIDVPFTVRVWP